MPSAHEFESYLHQKPFAQSVLQECWTEYVSLVGLPSHIVWKIEREFAHKFLQAFGATYFDGALGGGSIIAPTVDSTRITIDSTIYTIDSDSI